MARYLDMLRSRNIFRNQPLGMPDIDSGNVAEMFRSVVPLANSLKNDDARRQREMMEFQSSLAHRDQNRPQYGQPIAPSIAPPKTVFGGTHPLTSMQTRLQNEDEDKRAQTNRLATLGATQTGALNNALTTNRQQDDAQMARTVAEINGRAGVARDNRASIERAGEDARTDAAKLAADNAVRKRDPLIMRDPDNPGQDMSVRHNPVTNKMERVTIDDGQAGPARRMGVDKPGAVNPGQDPVKLAAIRKSAQSALNELDQLVDADGSLKTHTSDAVGKSRWLPDRLNDIGLGSFTPSTTKGREGLKSLRAKLVLDVIGQMKAQSKTGATGFGAMNLKELAVLEAAASKLENRDLSDDDFKAELGRIKERLKMVIEDDHGGSGGDRTDELIRKYGGG